MDLRIEKLEERHWEQVREIYIQGIETEVSTFNTEAPTFYEWDNSHIKDMRLVDTDGDKVLGWVALSQTSSRYCYRGVAEVSIYIREGYKGRGVGKLLLNSIIQLSEENGFWTLQSLVITENRGSIALHKSCGFRELGVREKIGKMNNKVWLDVAIMERRSRKVGV